MGKPAIRLTSLQYLHNDQVVVILSIIMSDGGTLLLQDKNVVFTPEPDIDIATQQIWKLFKADITY